VGVLGWERGMPCVLMGQIEEKTAYKLKRSRQGRIMGSGE